MAIDPVSAIGGIVSGIGGLFGASKAEKAAEKANAQNLAYQREFAQNGVQWRATDARKAGISPLAAMGAQLTSFSPSFVGSDAGSMVGDAISNMGQGIGRAIDSTRSQTEKTSAVQKTANDLQIQNMALQNEKLASEIALVRQTANPPAMPSPGDRFLVDGQGNAPAVPTIPVQRGPLVETDPLTRTASEPGRPFMEPGAINDIGFVRTSTGWSPTQSNDAKQRLEDDLVGEAMWSVRNRLAPTIGFNNNPPFAAPKGQFWWYEPLMQEYQLKPLPR